jgi:hypothetical protein
MCFLYPWLAIEHGWTAVGRHLLELRLLLLEQEDLLLHEKKLLLQLLGAHHHRVLHELLLVWI